MGVLKRRPSPPLMFPSRPTIMNHWGRYRANKMPRMTEAGRDVLDAKRVQAERERGKDNKGWLRAPCPGSSTLRLHVEALPPIRLIGAGPHGQARRQRRLDRDVIPATVPPAAMRIDSIGDAVASPLLIRKAPGPRTSSSSTSIP